MRFTAGIALLLSLFTTNAQAIDVWHSSNEWIQGVCSYQFTFDGQDMQFESDSGVTSLVLEVQVLDGKNKLIANGVIETESFADSSATRHTISYWEGDCEAKTFVIRKATAVIDGKTRNLLKTDGLHIRDSPLKESVNIKIAK